MRSFLKWVLIVFIVALVPVVVNFGVEHINIGVGNNETWIGFWGSYIGAIVTAFVFYFSLRNAVKKLKIEGHPYLLFSFIRDIKKDYDEDIKVIYHSNNSDEAENSIKNLIYGKIDMLYVENVSGYYVDYTENIIGFEQKFKKINNHNTIGKYSEGTLEKTIKCLKEKSNNDSIEDWVSIKPLMEML